MDRITFKNCDYKDLVNDLTKQNIKVDLILTDPPYGVSRTTQLGFSNMGRAGMNYGEWDYDFNQKEWIKLCAPLVKKGGSIIIFNDWKNFSYIVDELSEQGFIIKDLIRWEKPNPMPRNTDRRYVSDFELAIWAIKDGGKWTFNKSADSPYLKPVYKCSNVPSAKRIHPTQKPLKLFEDLILVHSNENDIVLDPFAGSATTAIACAKHNRIFIGSELDEKYFAEASKRIECYIHQ